MAEREWFYANGDTRQGPVPESALLDLIRQGTVGASTLVWTQGMPQWQRVDQVPGLVSSDGVEPSAAVPDPSDAGAAFRPTCVTVFGVLNIVFGGLAVLCLPFAALGLAMASKVIHMEFPPPVKMWMAVVFAMSVICSVARIVLGVGLLRMKKWARMGNYVYGWFDMVWIVAKFAIDANAMPQIPQQGLLGGPLNSTSFVLLQFVEVLWIVYPILLVVFMSRKAVKDAFGAVS